MFERRLMRHLLALAVCLSVGTACARKPVATSPASPATGANENLHAVLWAQTAVEYLALTRQTFALARLRLDAALADPRWTAAVEQTGAYPSLPPAVIVDVDETVLENWMYQARLAETDQEFAGDTWAAWIEEARATPVPGSAEFAQYAASKGVTLFYVTNREQTAEDATRRNLEAVGFPLDPAQDTVLTQGERPDWNSSDKTPRRRHVAESFRVLLLIGDDLGDFAPARGTLEERRATFDQHRDKWGVRWIVLPNPSYGSWERALTDFASGLSRPERLRLKRERLETGRQP